MTDEHKTVIKQSKLSKLRYVLLGSVLTIFGAFVIVQAVPQDSTVTLSSSLDSNKNLPSDLNYSEVEALYDKLRQSYDGDLSEEELIEGIKRGLVGATGDPYTEYFSSVEATEFREALEGTFTGIGAELGLENGAIIVVSPLSGFPAEKAGLKARDVIAKINDEDATGLNISQAVSRIRGEAGTDVMLTVIRNSSEVIELTITREVIDIPSVTTEINENGIAVIRIAQFSGDSSALVKEGIELAVQNSAKGLVIDVRGNPGGFLDSAVEISDLWLKKNEVAVDIRREGNSIDTLRAKSDDSTSLKTVVLINGGSASASEIVAGALHDNNYATIIGTKSFGKGSVQNLEKLGEGELLKVTTSRWFTPNGINIDKEGIEPDEVIEITDEQFDAGEDPQLNRAFEFILQ